MYTDSSLKDPSGPFACSPGSDCYLLGLDFRVCQIASLCSWSVVPEILVQILQFSLWVSSPCSFGFGCCNEASDYYYCYFVKAACLLLLFQPTILTVCRYCFYCFAVCKVCQTSLWWFCVTHKEVCGCDFASGRRQSCGNWSHSAAHSHKAWPAWSPQNLSKCLCDPIHLPGLFILCVHWVQQQCAKTNNMWTQTTN